MGTHSTGYFDTFYWTSLGSGLILTEIRALSRWGHIPLVTLILFTGLHLGLGSFLLKLGHCPDGYGEHNNLCFHASAQEYEFFDAHERCSKGTGEYLMPIGLIRHLEESYHFRRRLRYRKYRINAFYDETTMKWR